MTTYLKHSTRYIRTLLPALLAVLALAGCNSTTNSNPERRFHIGGDVSGLIGELTLELNGKETLKLTASGPFQFEQTLLKTGEQYQVTISQQPATQECRIEGESGTVGSDNVKSIQVTCSTVSTYTVGGVISSLDGTLKLQLNEGEPLEVTDANSFVFTNQPLKDGVAYTVSIIQQPEKQNCTIVKNSGKIDKDNIDNVTISCTTVATFSIGGTVNGLNGELQLSLNYSGQTDTLSLSNDSDFTFNRTLKDQVVFSVLVTAHPQNQDCSVTQPITQVDGENVTNIVINCVDTFALGGTVTGLNSAANNLNETLTLTLSYGETEAEQEALLLQQNGDFEFATRLPEGKVYQITPALTKPAMQDCSAEPSSGSMSNTKLDILVHCGIKTAELTLQPEGIKTFHFNWQKVTDASHYRLLEDRGDGSPELSVLADHVPASAADNNQLHFYQTEVPLYARNNSKYLLQTCYQQGATQRCFDGQFLPIKNNSAVNNLVGAIGYVKASNTDADDYFGNAVSLNQAGTVMAVGAKYESSQSGDTPANDSLSRAGAVYIYAKDLKGVWQHQAYIKADGPKAREYFGYSLSLDAAGKVLAVGVPDRDIKANGKTLSN
ncbi:FG-GAP repeat protein, partial [bacterium]|nr:FG-GAP repeat protein [bacterium]